MTLLDSLGYVMFCIQALCDSYMMDFMGYYSDTLRAEIWLSQSDHDGTIKEILFENNRAKSLS